MSSTWTRGWTIFLAALLASGSCLAGMDEPSTVGRWFRELPGSSGVLDSEGAELADGQLIRTLSEPALLRLDNGHVLKMLGNSALVIESGEAGDVTLTVLAGRLIQVGTRGGLLFAGSGSTITLSATYADASAAEDILLQAGPDARANRHDDVDDDTRGTGSGLAGSSRRR